MEKGYCLDLKKILDFIYYSSNHPIKESEITDIYRNNDKKSEDDNSNNSFDTTSKKIRETTSYGVAQIDNIRYDLVRALIQLVLEYDYDSEQDEEDEERTDSEKVPFGVGVAFNTLINEGFLKEIKVNKYGK